MRTREFGPNRGSPLQISQRMIVREYMRTHGIDSVKVVWTQVLYEHPELEIERFTPEQLNLSLDDFSRSLGWMT